MVLVSDLFFCDYDYDETQHLQFYNIELNQSESESCQSQHIIIINYKNMIAMAAAWPRTQVVKTARLIGKNLVFTLASLSDADADHLPAPLVCNDIIKPVLDMEDEDTIKAWAAITGKMKASSDSELEKTVGTAYKPLLAALLKAEDIIGSGRLILDRLHDASFEKAKDMVMTKDVGDAYKDLFTLLTAAQKLSATTSPPEEALLERAQQSILSVKIVLACQSGVVGTTVEWSSQSYIQYL